MTDQQPHAPTTEEVRLNYAYLGGTAGEREFDRRTESFDRWYAAEFGRIIAAAEQRGAAKELRDFVSDYAGFYFSSNAQLHGHMLSRAKMIEMEDRADQYTKGE